MIQKYHTLCSCAITAGLASVASGRPLSGGFDPVALAIKAYGQDDSGVLGYDGNEMFGGFKGTDVTIISSEAIQLGASTNGGLDDPLSTHVILDSTYAAGGGGVQIDLFARVGSIGSGASAFLDTTLVFEIEDGGRGGLYPFELTGNGSMNFEFSAITGTIDDAMLTAGRYRIRVSGEVNDSGAAYIDYTASLTVIPSAGTAAVLVLVAPSLWRRRRG